MAVKTATKPTTLQYIDKKIFEDKLSGSMWGSVRLWRGEQKKVPAEAYTSPLVDMLKVSVTASSVSSTDLDQVEKFANAILAACKEARKLNKEAGL